MKCCYQSVIGEWGIFNNVQDTKLKLFSKPPCVISVSPTRKHDEPAVPQAGVQPGELAPPPRAAEQERRRTSAGLRPGRHLPRVSARAGTHPGSIWVRARIWRRTDRCAQEARQEDTESRAACGLLGGEVGLVEVDDAFGFLHILLLIYYFT